MQNQNQWKRKNYSTKDQHASLILGNRTKHGTSKESHIYPIKHFRRACSLHLREECNQILELYVVCTLVGILCVYYVRRLGINDVVYPGG